MQIQIYVKIPARANAPETKLFIQMIAKDLTSLRTKPFVFVLPGGPTDSDHSILTKKDKDVAVALTARL